MDAHNILNACFGTLRVNPTCEIATHFLMRCWKYNSKAVDAQLVEGIYFLEDALDDDYIRDMNNTDNFSALDSGSAEYIGSAIDERAFTCRVRTCRVLARGRNVLEIFEHRAFRY